MTAKRPAGATEITLRLQPDLWRRLEREASLLNEGVGAFGKPASPEFTALLILQRELGADRRGPGDGIGAGVGGAKPERG